MKVALEFDLPDDQDELQHAQLGVKYWLALWEVYSYLRGQWKHGDPPDGIEAIWYRFHQILADEGVELD